MQRAAPLQNRPRRNFLNYILMLSLNFTKYPPHFLPRIHPYLS